MDKMSLTYDGLTIETEFDSELQILHFIMEQQLNEHAELVVSYLVRGENPFHRYNNNSRIVVKEKETCLFTGILVNIRTKDTRDGAVIETRWKSSTCLLDRKKHERAITGSDMTYGQLLGRLTASYGEIYQDTLSYNRLLPGFLLQYQETDWEFLKRLAARAGGVLTPKCTGSDGEFCFGFPNLKKEKISDASHRMLTTIDYEAYARESQTSPFWTFLMDHYQKCFTSAKNYWLGQRVEVDGFEGIVTHIHIEGCDGSVIKTYVVTSEAGIAGNCGVNPKFSGLHLEATVKEAKGSSIRVEFGIETITSGSELYFPYAVESSAWYAMPEVGSLVHIYLPEQDETLAYAVHSMRNTSAGAVHASATSDPSVKSFTHPSGASMQLDGSALTLTSDTQGMAQATLGGDGTLGLKAKKITITAYGNVEIGAGEKQAKQVELKAGKELTIVSDQGASAYLGEQLYLNGSRIDYAAEIKDAVEIPEEILNRNEGIEDQIDAINASAKEMEKAKIQEAKKKTGLGMLAMAIGAAAIAAAVVCTGGAALVAVAVVAGGAAIACGAGSVEEGVRDYKKAVESGDFSKSHNFMRDEVFQGNQGIYDAVLYGSVLICGIVIGVATGGGGMEAFKDVLIRTGKDVTVDTLSNLAMDYMDDGSINNGLESYLKNMCMAGSSASVSAGFMQKFKGMEAAEKYSCKQIGMMRYGLNTSMDVMTSYATTGDANLTKILVSNYISNKWCGADPVDMATGSLYIPATDMTLPDILEDYKVTRKYESINQRSGLLGYGWTCSLESCMLITERFCKVLMQDGHVETFEHENSEWINDKGASHAVTLTKCNGGWQLRDEREKKTFFYNEDGKLEKVTDRCGNPSVYTYKNGVLVSVTTFSGSVIQVEIENGRLMRLTDAIGRYVAYTYDGDHLVSVDQNGRGITRYTYDKKGYISAITDQNNKRYTENIFDSRGRVTGQNYPDKTSCSITYDDIAHCTTFFYPETGRTEKTYHDGRKLVTKIEYQDGTTEEYGYDEWQNCIYEKNRRDAVTRRTFTEDGHKIKEEFANGLAINYAYDGNGNCTKEWDNAGGCTRYRYDENGNLAEKSILCDAKHAHYKTLRYGYRRNGSLQWEEDAEGNRTEYYFSTLEDPEDSQFVPRVCISPQGYEFRHSYDKIGRRIRTETVQGITEYRYNGLHYVSSIKDPEGNVKREERDNLGNLIRKYSGRQSGGRTSSVGYSYRYDYLDRLIWVRDPLGREKTFIRDGRGNVLRESLLAKRTIPETAVPEIRSTYDANDHLLETIYPDGGIWKEKHDAEGCLVTEEMPDQNVVHTIYDSMDRILKQTDTDGKTIREYEYDLKGNVIREVDALGQDKCFRYDEAGRMTGVWEYVSPDEYRVTFYKYDDMDHVTEEKRGLHGVGKFETPTRYLTIKKTYDKEGRLVTVSDMSMEMQYTYDMMNNRTSETAVIDDRGTQRTVYYRYDSNGRLVEKKEDAGDKTLSVTAYTYDASDNLTGVTLPEGGKIFLIYDEAERLIYKLEREDRHHILRGIRYTYADFCPVSAEQLYGRQTTVREMNQLLIGMDSNALREFLNPEGADSEKMCQERATEQAYYQGKEALAVFHAFEKAYGNIENGDSHRYEKVLNEISTYKEWEDTSYSRSFQWDFRGNLLVQKDSLGGTWKYVYDLTGRLASATNPVGDKTSYVYDRFGRERSRINGMGDCEYTLDYDALGRVTARTDGEGNTTAFAYHPDGKIRVVTGPDNLTEYQAVYDIWGRPDSETDGNGNTTLYEKDRWGHVTGVTLPDGGVEKYRYDYAGNVTSATDANGNRTIFRYNGNNQLRSIEKENKSIRSFVYDAEGRCIRSLDANGNLAETVYNMDSNPVMITGTRNVSLSDFRQRLHATADEAGNFEERTPELRSLYTYDAQGNLVEASENGTVYHYTHDTEGRVLTKSAWGKTLYENRYDSCGRIRELVTGNQITSYRYDKAGRLAEACASNGIRAQYQYDRNGMQTTMLYGNGLRTSCTYDERSRLTGMETVRRDGTVLHKAAYGYDNAGNRIFREEQHTGRMAQIQHDKTGYTYDSMNRLTEEKRNDAVTAYRYDPAGNRIAKSTAGRTEEYFYNNRNQLTELHSSIAGTSVIRYTYDNAGNLTEEDHLTADGISKKKRLYAYDAFNRNTEITGNDFTQQNHYDAEGYRDTVTEKDLCTGNTKTTGFAYQQGMLLTELDENKEAIRHYIPGNAYIGVDNSYYLTDEQGSVRYVLSADANANVQNTYQYDAFGECTAREERIPNRLKYNAQIEDELTGLYYLRARYYNAGIGRFTQEDVIYNDGLNLYAYCGSNPVMYCDPSGYQRENSCIVSKESGSCSNTGSNSKKLSKNLKREGRPVRKGEAAAHIVASTGSQNQWKQAADSRRLLKKYNININDAANGIPLGHPRPHNTTHNGDFHRMVNSKLYKVEESMKKKGYGKKAIRSALRKELRKIGKQVEIGL